jgi:hypothetical protein
VGGIYLLAVLLEVVDMKQHILGLVMSWHATQTSIQVNPKSGFGRGPRTEHDAGDKGSASVGVAGAADEEQVIRVVVKTCRGALLKRGKQQLLIHNRGLA